jgi:hypothetical protein
LQIQRADDARNVYISSERTIPSMVNHTPPSAAATLSQSGEAQEVLQR